MRSSSLVRESGPPARNIYVSNLLASWIRGRQERVYEGGVLTLLGMPPDANTSPSGTVQATRLLEPETTLVDVLRQRSDPLGPGGLVTAKVIVIDQFEDLFTLYPQHWPDRAAVFEQLGAALEDDLLRVVIAIRDEHLAELESYSSLVPGGLRVRLRLEPLRADAAYSAITGPLRTTRRSFGPGVAESFVKDLQRLQVETGAGDSVVIEREEIDPARLQWACHEMWSNLPPDVQKISEIFYRPFVTMASNH